MDITIITGISIGVFTIIGVLTGIFFVFFKMLRDDIKASRREFKEELNQVRVEFKSDINKLDIKIETLSKDVNILGQKVSHMDGQITQITHMLYFNPHGKENHPQEDIKEN